MYLRRLITPPAVNGIASDFAPLLSLVLTLAAYVACLLIPSPPLARANLDWAFLNSVLGLKSASSTNPCFCCVVGHGKLLSRAAFRHRDWKNQDRAGRHSTRTPLLVINPRLLVPTPLHVLLGFGNRLFAHLYERVLTAEALEKALQPNKTVHAPGNTGASDFHEQNGPEIGKWIKRGTLETIIAAAADSGTPIAEAELARLRRAEEWLRQLHSSLLKKGRWNSTEMESFSILVADIWENWTSVTGDTPFPKLHMLAHLEEFAKAFRYLGDSAESPIERFHATFNFELHTTNRNKANDKEEQYRRSHAQCLLATIHVFAPA
jgi:hypothetical protein